MLRERERDAKVGVLRSEITGERGREIGLPSVSKLRTHGLR